MVRPRGRGVAMVTGKVTRSTNKTVSAWERNRLALDKDAGFPAKYPGRCPRCGLDWRVGDAIRKVVKVYYHAECMAKRSSTGPE